MALPLRVDFDAASLRLAARRAKDAGQARRLLALASIHDGSSRTEAARIGGVTLQIIRNRPGRRPSPGGYFHQAYAVYYTNDLMDTVIVRVLHGARDTAALAERDGFRDVQ